MSVLTVSGDQVRCVLPWEAEVGESPIWHSAEQKLYWIDIQKRKIHRFHPASGENQTFTLPDIVTSLALRAGGGLLVTLKKHFALYDPATGAVELL